MPTAAATNAVKRLASRSARTEADLQADVYLLLTSGGLSLDPSQVARLEAQIGDGTRRRVDVEIGHCVIEVKKDLRMIGVLREAEEQLLGYVLTQTERLGSRYLGVLTDGTDWHLYHLEQGVLVSVAHLSLNERAPDVERLLVWLESILATQDAISPVPLEVDRRLGVDSPAHLLDHAALVAMYGSSASVPEVRLKRDLWAKLLRTAFGKAFDDDEHLFIDHTLLVLTAEVIAHAVVGFDISSTSSLGPITLARGTEFANAQIYGVVEADFFDWVLDVPGGPEFITELARRIARFDWSDVQHDVLKTLYESIISPQARAKLGEYYTPDWLADRIVTAAIPKPLTTRVLDPACGSGTFLFHAARAFLQAADAGGVANGTAVLGLTERVFGMDIHPVAVTLARVTYLLAIGQERLAAEDRGPITVPVYLGDSVQWEQHRDLLNHPDAVTISTAGTDLVEGGGTLFGDDLVFPRNVLDDAGDFDRLVSIMADKAMNTSSTSSGSLIAAALRQFGVHEKDVATLTTTFDAMRRLHASGRDHIWGYYVRNLVRPLWLAEPSHHVDVLIGNPPWLRYSKMTDSMQERYKDLARRRGLLSGGLGASSRDLSTLFVARAVELYLKRGGRFSFVMPFGTLTRKPHHGFRSGHWKSPESGGTAVEFSEAWDLSSVDTGFPMVSCVVNGTAADSAAPIPATVQRWTGRLNPPNVEWSIARKRIIITTRKLSVLTSEPAPAGSPYKARFRQGAVLAPRALLFVNRGQAGPLGAGAGRLSVSSRRTTTEKPPWKSVPSLNGSVERAFVREVLLGQSLLPYRLLDPLQAVLPISETAVLTATQIDDHAALAAWWEEAENTWAEHKSSSDTSALLDRIDFHGQLKAQLPSAKHRVLYTASGNSLAAARVEVPYLIEHKLYWAAVSGVAEARYLTAILNSTIVLERVKPLQAIGLFGGRDFDKHVFVVPIPTYNSGDANHQRLVDLALEAEQRAAELELEPNLGFQRARAEVRAALETCGVAGRIEAVVASVVPAIRNLNP